MTRTGKKFKTSSPKHFFLHSTKLLKAAGKETLTAKIYWDILNNNKQIYADNQLSARTEMYKLKKVLRIMNQLKPAQCITLVIASLSWESSCLWDPENEATPILLLSYNATLQRSSY